MPEKKKVYLVIFTDKWQVDYVAEEVWSSESRAEKRAKDLTAKQLEPEKWFYVVEEKEIKD